MPGSHEELAGTEYAEYADECFCVSPCILVYDFLTHKSAPAGGGSFLYYRILIIESLLRFYYRTPAI